MTSNRMIVEISRARDNFPRFRRPYPAESGNMDDRLMCSHESAADLPAIRAVVEAAFGRPGEGELVDNLRRSGLLTVSAVAICGEGVAGHASFSPVTIGGLHHGLALAPVAVAPERQRQGIGSAVIRWGLEEC